MKKTTLHMLAALLALAGQTLAQTPGPVRTLVNPNLNSFDNFGYSVAIDDNNVLVGAPFDNSAGAAYLFNVTNGTLLQTFMDPNPDPNPSSSGNRFGFSVAIRGNKVLIGAPFSINGGAAYLFDRILGSLIQLRNPTQFPDDRFGSLAAFIGNNVFIGAPFNDRGASDAGAAYLFDGNNGQLLHTFTNPSPDKFDLFGNSVAAVDSNIIIGAHFDDTAGIDAGTLYVFDDSTYSLRRAIPNPDKIRGAGFGFSMATAGNNVFVGAPFDFTRFGVVYQIDGNSTSPSFGDTIRTFKNPITMPGENFGLSVAAVDNNILIGSPEPAPTPPEIILLSRKVVGNDLLSDASNVKVKKKNALGGTSFLFNGTNGSLLQTFSNPAAKAFDRFGYSVSLAGSNIIIGTPLDDTNGENAGLVYVFSTAPINCSLSITAPKNGAVICSDSVNSQVRLEIRGGVPPFTIEYDFYGIKGSTMTMDTVVILTKKVPLSIGPNTLVANATITDSRKEMSICAGTVRVTRLDVPRPFTINEVLSNPNFSDLGAEKIELKNTSKAAVLLDSTFALWIRRGNSDTYWTFRKNRVRLAPNQLFVIHWLGKGLDDEGNVFTGAPSDGGNRSNSRDGFWGNNSADSSQMMIGGDGDTGAFSIALMQNIVPGNETGFTDPCNMVDFVQACGRVTASESLAVEAGLWSLGNSFKCAEEGNSYDENGNENPSPSFGSDNPQLLPAKHLLLSEICVLPDNSEFIEIYNPTGSPIELRNYYLTNAVSVGNSAGYTRLVFNRPESLAVQSGEFIVRFPAGATIGVNQFQTIAFNGATFKARYNVNPAYEIIPSDTAIRDMEIIKTGPSGPDATGLGDADAALVLLRWDAAADLVQDADYVVWGEPVTVPEPAKLFAINPQSQAAAVGPPEFGVNKTGVGIDGIDANAVRSYYNNETAIDNQVPIANNPHAALKSWQRTDFSETGEKRAGGNGISGHDEMSENLAGNFKEAKPTPGGTEKSGPLDGLRYNTKTAGTIVDNPVEDIRLKNVGFPNKIINPGETVKFNVILDNAGPLPTGPFFTILRALDPVVTMIDSTSFFNSIDTGRTDTSLSAYVFAVDKVVLPDSLRFVLIVIQKSSGPTSTPINMVDLNASSAVRIKKIFFTLATSNVTFDVAASTIIVRKPDTTLLRFNFQLKNVGTIDAPDTRGKIINRDSLMVMPLLTIPPPIDDNPLDSISLGDIPINNMSSKKLEFILKPSFAGRLTSFGVRFSWGLGAARDKVAYTMNYLRPDSIVVFGKVTFDDLKAIAGATVIYKRPDPNPNPPPNTPSNVLIKTTTTDAKGDYNFPLAFSEAQGLACSLSVSMTILPKDSAITNADLVAAMPLCTPPMVPILPPKPYRWIAANVQAIKDTVVNAQDCLLIQEKACCPNKNLWNPAWVFIDASYPIKHTNWQRAPQRAILNLGNYNVQVNFIGIILGDVDGNRNGNPSTDKPPGCMPENCGASGTQ